MSILGENLKRLRRDKKITLAALSNKTGIPVSTLNGIEKGAKTSYDKILKLSEVFNIETNDLLGIKKDGNLKSNPIIVKEQKAHNTIEEFKFVANNTLSDEEKEMIFKLVEYYNRVYYNDRYDLSKIDDDTYMDLRNMFYISIKTILKNYQK